MSFPLLPIQPQAQDDKTPASLAAINDSEQVPFAIIFGLESQTEEQIFEDNSEEGTGPEVSADPLETEQFDATDPLHFAVSKTPKELPKAHAERQPQTLVESAFFPAVGQGSPARSQDDVAPIRPENPKPAGMNEARPFTPAVVPSTQDIAPKFQAEVPKPSIEKRAAHEGRNDGKPAATTSERATLVAATQPANPPVQRILPPVAKGPRIETSERTSPTPIQPQAAVTAPPQAAILAAQPMSATVPKTAFNVATELGVIEKLTDIPLVQGQGDIQSGGLRTASHDLGHLPPQPQHVAKSVANQMAVAVAQNGAGTTELILSPEELGRVRMIMSSQDGGIAVLIQTERPETNDLLRRYIETLAQEFRNMGYNSTSFAFSQDQQGGSAQSAGTGTSGGMLQDNDSDVQKHALLISSEGLDLRL